MKAAVLAALTSAVTATLFKTRGNLCNSFTLTLPSDRQAKLYCSGPPRGRQRGRTKVSRCAVNWGPLGPAEAAEAFKIYYLPFVPPLDIDTTLNESLFDILGPLTPLLIGGLTLFIQAQINNFRREQEGKAVSTAAGAVANAAGGAARSAADSVGERLARIPAAQWAKLLLCIAVDVAGDASFLFPGLGELGDVAYGPIEGLILKALFGGNVLALVGVIEEGLPFTDAVPTATTGWVLQSLFPDSPICKLFGIEPLPDRVSASSEKQSATTVNDKQGQRANPVESKVGSPDSTRTNPVSGARVDTK